MSVRGVNPSYFAGMPTVQRDPHAGQMGEGYAQMPGQALTEAANMRQRQSEVSDNNAFRAREQSHREAQDASSASRDDKRLAMYQQGEDRRQSQQQFENDRLKAADTRKLLEALQSANNAGESGISEAIVAELKSRGWGAKPIGAQGGAAPAQPTRQAAPGGATPQRAPMSPADAQTSRELDQAEASIIPKLRGSSAPGRPASAASAGLGAQLDQAGDSVVRALSGGPQTPLPYEQALKIANSTGALGVKQVPGGWTPISQEESDQANTDNATPQSRGLLPGRAMRPQVAQSNQFLSADDPYNKLAQ